MAREETEQRTCRGARDERRWEETEPLQKSDDARFNCSAHSTTEDDEHYSYTVPIGQGGVRAGGE